MTEPRFPDKTVHPVCEKMRELRKAAGLSLTDMEKRHGISAVMMGSYERGDRTPPLSKIDALLGMFGYTLAAVPIDSTAVRENRDMVADLHAIADQLSQVAHGGTFRKEYRSTTSPEIVHRHRRVKGVNAGTSL